MKGQLQAHTAVTPEKEPAGVGGVRIGMDGMSVIVFYRAVNKFLIIVGFVLIIPANR
jgi:hypothetical protein